MRTQRTIGLILMAIMLAVVATTAGFVLWFGPVAGLAIVAGAVALVILAYVTLVGPWQRRWGAVREEVLAMMPGDELLPPDADGTTRAITIDATPSEVFPWLVQIGFGKAGWYSYDRIDNDGVPSADRIHEEWQDLAPGDRIVMMPPAFGPVVREVVAARHILSAGDADTWCLQVRPTPDGTRLVSRWRQRWPRSLATTFWILIADPGAFIMERKMLRTIKRRVESAPAVVEAA